MTKTKQPEKPGKYNEGLSLTKRQFVNLIRGLPNSRSNRSIDSIRAEVARRSGEPQPSRPLITAVLKGWGIKPTEIGVFENTMAFLDHDSKMASDSIAGRDTNVVALEQVNSMITTICLKAEEVINNILAEDLQMEDAFLLSEVALKGLALSTEIRKSLVDTVKTDDVVAPAPKDRQDKSVEIVDNNVVTDFSTFLDAAASVAAKSVAAKSVAAKNGKTKNGK